MARADISDNELSTLMLRHRGVVRAIELMRSRLAEQMSLEHLARTAAMSRFHFDRVFHQITGLRPFQFLSAMRLVHARELILGTDAPITEICFDVGYTSVGTFTRRFTASVGASPRRLRRFSRAHPTLTLAPPATAEFHPVGSGADIIIHCRGIEEDTRVFVGAFPSPMPIGRPQACGTAVGRSSVTLPDVPPGRYYILAAARPTSPGSRWFGGIETLVGVADRAPIRIEDQTHHELTMDLRPVEVTDPPVVSFLPLLFHESCACAAFKNAALNGFPRDIAAGSPSPLP